MGRLHLLAVAAFGSAAAAAITEEVFVIGNLEFLKVQNDIHLVSPSFLFLFVSGSDGKAPGRGRRRYAATEAVPTKISYSA
jgi:hypothetical protein